MPREFRIVSCFTCKSYRCCPISTFCCLWFHRDLAQSKGRHILESLDNTSKPLSRLTAAMISPTAEEYSQEPNQQLEQQNFPSHAIENHRRLAKEVFQLLRYQRTDLPQWIPLRDIIGYCSSRGLPASKVPATVSELANEGFLEIKEDLVRVIPLQ